VFNSIDLIFFYIEESLNMVVSKVALHKFISNDANLSLNKYFIWN